MKSPHTAHAGEQPAKGAVRSDIWIRAAAASILIPIALIAEWLGSWFFAAFAAACGALIVMEFLRMAVGGRPVMLLATALLALFAAAFATLWGGVVVAAIILLAAALALALIAGQMSGHSRRRLFAAASIIYAGAPVVALVILRQDDLYGLGAVLWLLCVVWATDTGAYIAGRMIGGPKLWPRASPKKTWAGLAGGAMSAAAVGYVASQWIAGGSTTALVALSVLLAIVAQAGDLLESLMKRHFNVKDSGTLIPGHGGAMDRLDGVVTAAVLAGLVGIWRGGEAAAGAGLLIW